MNILNIFENFKGDSAGLAFIITFVFLILFSIFFFGSIRRAQLAGGGKWYKQNMAKYFLIPIAVFWFIAMLMIRSDYRPYDPKKDGVPEVQTDSTRISAEDLIKLQNKNSVK